MQDTKLEDYKKKVGYYSLPAVQDDVGVFMDWRGLLSHVPALEEGWEVVADGSLDVGAGRATRTWLLTKPDESSASIEVSMLVDAAHAREEVIRSTSETMALESAFKSLGGTLGDFSVGNINSQYDKIVWSRGNAMVSVYLQPPTGSVRGIDVARSIDALMTKHTVTNLFTRRPTLSTVKFSKTSLQVGESLQVDSTVASTGGDVEVFIIDPEWRLSEESATQFKAVKAGQSAVSVMAVDTHSLLFAQQTKTVTINP